MSICIELQVAYYLILAFKLKGHLVKRGISVFKESLAELVFVISVIMQLVILRVQIIEN
jgi:hypothetical protein